jgi:YesN/AraC family two-component response regulator
MLNGKAIQISLCNIAPFVRYADLIHLNPNIPAILKTTYDHRILYVYSGKGTVLLNNESFPCKKGDLFFWGPLTKYSVERDSKDPATIINVCFDFTQNYNSKRTLPNFTSIENFSNELLTEKVEFTDCKAFNMPFRVRKFYEAEDLLLNIVNEHRTQKMYYLSVANGLLISFIMRLARYLSLENGKSKEKYSTINEIIEYIHNHYTDNLSNKKLSTLFNFHPNYINRLMVTATGTSLHQYVLNVKIRKAKELIQNSTLSLTEISESLSFSDISHFSKAFRKIMGYNPSRN